MSASVLASRPALPAKRRGESPAVEAAAIDAHLVRRFAAGDAAAFAEIFQRHRARILSLTFGVLRNRADAEEMTQDTFVRAYRALGNFRGECTLATWLHSIAVNLARNRYWYYVRRGRRNSVSLECSLGEPGDRTLADIVPDEGDDPAKKTVNREYLTLIETCMGRLAPLHREILTLRLARNLSYEEMVDELGIQMGTVKSRIARARGALLALVAEACGESAPVSATAAWLESPRAIYRRLANGR
jgi:RNA polymerase sigma-70 factor (ECF subfamily)